MRPSITVSIIFDQMTERPSADAVRAARAADQARVAAEQAQVNADRAIENAIQAAENAVQAGENAPPPPAPPVPGAPGAPGAGPIIFTDDNGQPVTIKMNDGNLVLTQEGNTQVIPLRDVVPREAVQIVWAIPATLSILLIWWPLSRAVIRWLNRKNVANNEAAALEARMRDRFETIERNLDTVAIEMERLSEGQRFTNKLLAERAEQVERVPVNGQR